MPVMIVDDNEHVCEFLSFLLQDEGFQPLSFDAPNKALAHIKAHAIQPRFLITDFNLPQMNGYELHLAVSEIVPAIQTIVISGRKVEDEIGNLPFLQKPFAPDELLLTMRALQPVEQTA
ncbi:MAG: response regulator [Mariprofundaceae bacterium]